MLCRAMSKPTDLLMTAALRVLAYLSRHKHVGLRYTPCAQPLEGFADADWAVRHSQSGFLFRLGRAAVSWGSKKQVSVALSTCEAEIMAASEAAKEAVHLRSLYNELTQSEAGPTRLHLDCKAAIDTAYNPEHHSKLKHVQRRHFFIRQVVEDHHIIVPYVETDKNLADFFTKPLPARKFFELRKAIMNEPNES